MAQIKSRKPRQIYISRANLNFPRFRRPNVSALAAISSNANAPTVSPKRSHIARHHSRLIGLWLVVTLLLIGLGSGWASAGQQPATAFFSQRHRQPGVLPQKQEIKWPRESRL